jgi:hypothetical protein
LKKAKGQLARIDDIQAGYNSFARASFFIGLAVVPAVLTLRLGSCTLQL